MTDLFLQSTYKFPTQIKSQETGKSTKKICGHKTYFFSYHPTEPAKHHDKCKIYYLSYHFLPPLRVTVVPELLDQSGTFRSHPSFQTQSGSL
jgi:hypothetical protein